MNTDFLTLDPKAILFEDNHCLAVAKPAPLLTQGVPPGIPTLEAMVKSYLKERYHKPGNVYLGIPHRLVVGDRGLEAGRLEHRYRRDSESTEFPADEAVSFIKARAGR